MARRPVYFAIAVFFLLYHPSSGVDYCASISGVLVNYCVSGTSTASGSGTSTGTGSASHPPSPVDVEPCKEYIYNGRAKKMYQYTGSLPFTITIKSTSITGNGITIGRFECQVGAPPEECYIYTIQNSATPPFSLRKDNNKHFGIHGKGSLTFIIYEGDCNPCPGDGSLGSDCNDDEKCCDVDNSICQDTCVCADGYYEDSGICVECKDYDHVCSSSSECCALPYMECISGICVCIPGRVYSGHPEGCVPECTGDGSLGSDCTDDVCCDVANSVCENTCECRNGYIEASGSCVGHPCGSISPRISGVYKVSYEKKTIEVFCEFRGDHGYMFLPTPVLQANPNINVDSLFEDKSKALIKFKYQGSQYDAEISQIPAFNSIPLSIQSTKHVGFKIQIRVSSPYLYFGVIPLAQIAKNDIQGYTVNGFNYTFPNCDGNPNSQFIFFLGNNMANDANPNGGVWYGIRPWFTHKVASAVSLPDRFFYIWDMHHGGCGVYHRTNGGALGIRFLME